MADGNNGKITEYESEDPLFVKIFLLFRKNSRYFYRRGERIMEKD